MKYNILTETAFFRAAQNGSLEDMTASYDEFIERVVDVCVARMARQRPLPLCCSQG